MRYQTYLRATALSLVLLTASAPVWATRTSTALAICVSRGADCSIANKGNDYEICVNNTDGKQCVSCPNLAQDKQDCSVARTGKDAPPPTTGVAGLLTEEYMKVPRKPEHPRKP